MALPAIEVEGVSKRYSLGSGALNVSLVDRLGDLARVPRRVISGRRAVPQIAVDSHAHEDEEFWALRDVSMRVERGEVLGLIGANGAGKSTLLKLIARITRPDTGTITLNGRVGTLLEVGTGFHPELTGRENAFLSGTILGMRRQEVADNFDEIVDFSGIGEFIDTPVKHYSSGMYVRLAFAVAAFLNPEILAVDEVLAVGDAEFQRRCLGRMQDVVNEGRTIVFVSHNLSAVQRLCPRSAWIHHGRLMAHGPTAEIISKYLRETGPQQYGGSAVLSESVARSGSGPARLSRISLIGGDGEPTDHLALGEPLRIELIFDSPTPLEDAVVELTISSAEGFRIVNAQSVDEYGTTLKLKRGPNEVTVELDLTLLPGEYNLEVALQTLGGLTVDMVERALRFSALNITYQGVQPYLWEEVRGSVRARSTWSMPGSAGMSAKPSFLQN